MSDRILVTGGAGFIGSHIATSLLSDGYDVEIVDNLSTGKLENIPSGANFREVDLRFPDAVKSLPENCRAVLHLAGQSSGEKSFDDPLYDLDSNCRSTSILATWALTKGVRTFIYASSMGVYGEPESYPVAESTVPQPISYYGASKYAAEQQLRVASLQGLRAVCFRMFSVYGPGQNLADMRQGMVSIFLAQMLREKSVLVKGSLARVRDFVYIDDVVTAWKLVLEMPVSGVFNLGTGRGTTVRELIAKLAEACGLESSSAVAAGEGTLGDQFALSADISLARDVLGWRPEISLEEGIARTVEWARSRF